MTVKNNTHVLSDKFEMAKAKKTNQFYIISHKRSALYLREVPGVWASFFTTTPDLAEATVYTTPEKAQKAAYNYNDYWTSEWRLMEVNYTITIEHREID